MLHPLVNRLGWDAQDQEESNVSTLRSSVLVALGQLGDESVIAEARRRFEIALRDPKAGSADIRRTALLIVARNADGETLDRLIALFRATEDPLEKQNMLEAIEDVADPAGAQRILELAVGPDAPSGSAISIVVLVAIRHPDVAWNFALQHGDQLRTLANSQFLMPNIAQFSSDSRRAVELQTYADKNMPPEAREGVDSAIASIKQNAKFRAERLPEIDAWLAKNANQ